MVYLNANHVSFSDQKQGIIDDLKIDIECARKQAENGPYYPNVTKESLLRYAENCEKTLAVMVNGSPEYNHEWKSINDKHMVEDFIMGKLD
jgi:hypothetical protein